MPYSKEINREKVHNALHKIVELFTNGQVPQAISLVTFPPFQVPSNQWSLLNRLVMFASGTADARGWKQWQTVGRSVKKGEKAFYILAPRIIYKKQKDEEKNEEKKVAVCTGFMPVPVFSVEQTEGKELKYENIKMAKLPLSERAEEWGIQVKGVAFQGNHHGYYQQKGSSEMICLATPEEKVFFHELSHAAHKRIKGDLQGGQDPVQEIVAELSAAVLAKIAGKDLKDTSGNSFKYIKHYAEKMNVSVEKACRDVLHEVDQVLALILKV